jgi:hypothetical protein
MSFHIIFFSAVPFSSDYKSSVLLSAHFHFGFTKLCSSLGLCFKNWWLHDICIPCKLRTIEFTSCLRKYAFLNLVPHCAGIKSVDDVANNRVPNRIFNSKKYGLEEIYIHWKLNSVQ